MRKRVAGAGLLVAIGIGIWLSSLFDGLGPGGKDSGIGRTDNVMVSVENTDASGESSPSSDTEQSTPDRAPTVLIDGHEYLLQLGSGAEESFKPVELSEIVRLAQQTRPGPDGIRLHIKRRESSRATAETALENALHQAGVQPSEIQQHYNRFED